MIPGVIIIVVHEDIKHHPPKKLSAVELGLIALSIYRLNEPLIAPFVVVSLATVDSSQSGEKMERPFAPSLVDYSVESFYEINTPPVRPQKLYRRNV